MSTANKSSYSPDGNDNDNDNDNFTLHPYHDTTSVPNH